MNIIKFSSLSILCLILMTGCSNKNSNSTADPIKNKEVTVIEENVRALTSSDISIIPDVSNASELLVRSGTQTLNYDVKNISSDVGGIKLSISYKTTIVMDYNSSTCGLNVYKKLSPNQSCRLSIQVNTEILNSGVYPFIITATDNDVGNILASQQLINVTDVLGLANNGSSNSESTGAACKTNYHLSNRTCQIDVKACSPLPANSLTGTQTWNGTSFNACQISACNGSYLVSTDSLSCNLPATITFSTVNAINSTNKSSYTISGTCSNNASPVNLTIGSINTIATCSSLAWTKTLDVSSLADGTISLSASHLNAGGNIATAISSALKGTSLPTISINTPSIINIANKSAYTISGNCSVNSANVNLSVGSYSSTAICSSFAWTKTFDASSITDNASVSISVNIQDQAGNTGLANASVLKDTIAPVLSISTLAIINNANNTNYTLSGTCSDSGINVSLIIGGISTTAPCNLLTWTKTLDVSSLVDSTAISITASMTDVAGNIGSTSSSVLKDTSNPTITIVATNIVLSNATTYTLSGACSENGQTVSFSVGSINSTVTCSSLSWTKTLDVSSLSDGTISLSASISDISGNSAVANTTVLKDTIVPTIAISTMTAINNANQAAYTMSGTCSENGQTINLAIGSVTSTVSCSSLSFSKVLNVSTLTDSTSIAATASISDAVGNTGTANANVLKDIVIPTIAISTPVAITGTNQSSYTLSGTCSEESSNISLVVGAASSTTTCSSSAWTKTFNVSAVSDSASVAISATITDLAGNNSVANSTVSKNTMVACTLADTQANLWDIANAATVSGNVSGVNISGCAVATCVGSFIVDNALLKCKTTTFHKNTNLMTSSSAPTTTNGIVYGVVKLSDGSKIYYGDFSRYGSITAMNIFKLSSTGVFDTTFNSNVSSKYNFTVRGAIVDGSNNIFITGQWNTANGAISSGIAKLSSTGVENTTFGAGVGAGVLGTGYTLAFDSTGALYVGGTFSQWNNDFPRSLAKINATSGAIDSTWKTAVANGFYSGAAIVASIAIDASNNIYAGGTFNGTWNTTTVTNLMKLSSTGVADTVFQANKIATMGAGVISAVKLSGSNLFVGGTFSVTGATSINLIKLNMDATKASTFNSNYEIGISSGYSSLNGAVLAIDLDSAGNVYVGGNFDTYTSGINNKNNAMRIAKFDSSGVFDTVFSSNLDYLPVSPTLVERLGHSGFTSTVLFIKANTTSLDITGRFTGFRNAPADGFITLSLAGIGGLEKRPSENMFDGSLLAIAKDSVGNIYLGGTFNFYNGVLARGLVKIDRFGNVNRVFADNIQSGAGTGYVTTIMIDSSDNVYVGGVFTSFGGAGSGGYNTYNKLVKLNSNGVIDSTFMNNYGSIGLNSTVRTIAKDSLGNIYVGGDFTGWNSIPNNAMRIAKFSSTGIFDTTFSNNLDVFSGMKATTSGLDGPVYCITIDPSDNLYVGGGFTKIKGVTNSAGKLIKMYTSGIVNSSFTTAFFAGDTIAPGFAPGNISYKVYTIILDSTNSNIFVGTTPTNYNNVSDRVPGIAKISVNGVFDSTFSTNISVAPGNNINGIGGSSSQGVYSLARDSLDNIYAVGLFTTFKGITNNANRVFKLNSAGIFNTAFSNNLDVSSGMKAPTSGFNNTANVIMAYDSDSIMIGGIFLLYKDQNYHRLLNIDLNGLPQANP